MRCEVCRRHVMLARTDSGTILKLDPVRRAYKLVYSRDEESKLCVLAKLSTRYKTEHECKGVDDSDTVPNKEVKPPEFDTVFMA